MYYNFDFYLVCRMLEKSCVRVEWGALLTQTDAAKSSFHWMTNMIADWGDMPLYLPAYLPGVPSAPMLWSPFSRARERKRGP